VRAATRYIRSNKTSLQGVISFLGPKNINSEIKKNHQKLNCGCIRKKLGHVIDKHVSFHLIHENLTVNIKVKRSRGQGHKSKKITKLAIKRKSQRFFAQRSLNFSFVMHILKKKATIVRGGILFHWLGSGVDPQAKKFLSCPRSWKKLICTK
jgi:hypothetical protein